MPNIPARPRDDALCCLHALRRPFLEALPKYSDEQTLNIEEIQPGGKPEPLPNSEPFRYLHKADRQTDRHTHTHTHTQLISHSVPESF